MDGWANAYVYEIYRVLQMLKHEAAAAAARTAAAIS
jgi:hypothetical protein